MPTYIPSEKDARNLDNNFRYHAPIEGQVERYQSIRDKAKELAALIISECPPSRETSVALTELETAVMWANAAIARNETSVSKA